MRTHQLTSVMALFGQMSNDSLMQQAMEAGELVPSRTDADAYESAEGGDGILVVEATCADGSGAEHVISIESVRSDRFNGGFAIIRMSLGGQPIPSPLPAELWSQIRPELKRAWQEKRAAASPSKALSDLDPMVFSLVVDGSSGAYRALPKEGELSGSRQFAMSMSAAFSGLDPHRAVQLAKETHHVLDALLDANASGIGVILTPDQAHLIAGIVATAAKR